jgi:hypothetical protein
VNIYAPPEAIWPWLIQMGQGRGGFYSYDWIERLLGLQTRNADRIIPTLQELHAADEVPLSPNGVGLPVDIIVPNRTLVMHADEPIQAKVAVMQPGYYRRVTWSFHLEPIDQANTRLIERWRADWDPTWSNAAAIYGVLEPGAFVMQRQMLLGIKARVERAWASRDPVSNQLHSPLMDAFLPEYEFRGDVSVVIHASPSKIFSAVREVTLADMPLAQALGEIRRLPGRLASQMSGGMPRHEPFINLMLNGMGSVVLAEEPNCEIAIGTIGKLHSLADLHFVSLANVEAFLHFNDPDYEKLAASVRIDSGDANSGYTLTLEHRTHALSEAADRKYAACWLAIKPSGNFVSKLFLTAVKRRAETVISQPA